MFNSFNIIKANIKYYLIFLDVFNPFKAPSIKNITEKNKTSIKYGESFYIFSGVFVCVYKKIGKKNKI